VRPPWREGDLIADYKQVPVILGVELAIWPNRERRVRCSQSQIQKQIARGDREHVCVPLGKRVKIAVLAVHIDIAVGIDRWHVDAPLEAVGMVGHARDRSIRIARAVCRETRGGSGGKNSEKFELSLNWSIR